MTVRSVQRALQAALKESGLQKHATVHTLRHSVGQRTYLRLGSICASFKPILATVLPRPQPFILI